MTDLAPPAASVIPAEPAVPARQGIPAAVTAGDAGRLVVLGGLCLTLALLPFEGSLLHSIATPGGRLTVTDVEAMALVTFLGWLVLLAAERRRPAVPRSVGGALAALALITALSAAAAGVNTPLGTQVAARAALSWGLFLVAIDLVRAVRPAVALLGVLLLTVLVSAGVGWIAAWHGSMDGLFGAGRLFSVGGVARMAGTWDYPTIAAMAWESVLLAALPLVALRRPRGAASRVITAGLVVALVVIGGAILMTLTRGAFLGLAVGLAVMIVAAVALRSGRLAAVATLAAVLLAGGATLLYLTSPLPIDRLVSESDRSLYGADYVVTGRIAVAPGAALRTEVTLTNTGQATWRPDGDHPWRLSAVWISSLSRAVVTAHQVAAELPGPVPPGASVTVQAVVSVPSAPVALDLAWDMQQVDVVEFSERDVPVAITHVTIDADAAGKPSPVTPARRLVLYPDKLPVLERSQLWTAAVRLIWQHPLLGVGPGVYRRVYGAQLDLTSWDTQIHANDLYLELAATTGLLGLGAFLLTVGLALRAGARGLMHARSRAGVAPVAPVAALVIVGSLAATAAALGHGIVDHFLVFVPMAILFWVLLGIGVGLAMRIRAEAAS